MEKTKGLTAAEMTLAFTHMQEGVVIQDYADKILDHNPAACKLLALTPRQLVGLDSFDPRWEARDVNGNRLSGDQHPSIVALRTKQPVERFIMQIHDGENKVRWLSVNAIPIVNSPNPIEHQVICTFTDISESQVVHQKLSEISQDLNFEKSRFSNLIYGLNKGSIAALTNHEGNIIFASDRFCEISGYSQEELVGKNHRILKSGIMPKEIYSDLWKTISKGNHWHGEICNKSKSGELYWVDTTIIPIPDGQGKFQYFALRVDITDKKNSEHLALDNAKLLAIGETAGSIAHEINNPLTIILAKTSQIKKQLTKGAPDSSQLQTHFDLIQATGERIAKIVKGLKSLSRTTEPELREKVNLTEVISDTIAICQERLKTAGIELRTNLPEQVELNCNSVQISQVLLNLINNSIDAITGLENPWIEILLKEEQYDILIAVTDSGSGIPEEVAKKIMHSRYSTKPRGKGTGLGLSLSRRIVEAHFGKFFIDKSCANTRFVIQIPKSTP